MLLMLLALTPNSELLWESVEAKAENGGLQDLLRWTPDHVIEMWLVSHTLQILFICMCMCLCRYVWVTAEARRWHQIPSRTGVPCGGCVPSHVDARN